MTKALEYQESLERKHNNGGAMYKNFQYGSGKLQSTLLHHYSGDCLSASEMTIPCAHCAANISIDSITSHLQQTHSDLLAGGRVCAPINDTTRDTCCSCGLRGQELFRCQHTDQEEGKLVWGCEHSVCKDCASHDSKRRLLCSCCFLILVVFFDIPLVSFLLL